MTFPKPYADQIAKLRVPSGFLLAATFAWFSRPSLISLAIGFPISCAGLAVRAWAAGHLAKNRQLTTSGPYAFVRNPLYLGTGLVALGLVTASRSVALGLVFGAVFILIYLPVIQLEEQHLRSLFPDFADYSAKVAALMPRFRPLENPQRFHFSLYRKNREYEALLGYAAGFCFLLTKALFTRQG